MEAALFDLDGTLLDTIGDLADSMNAVLSALDQPEHPEEAYRKFVGEGVENLVRRALPPDRRDAKTVTHGVRAMREEYGRRWNVRSAPYPGIPEMLRDLHGRGLPLAILSNKPHDFTLLTVEKMLPAEIFTVIRGVRKGVPRKPDPTAARQIARELGATPERVLYLGDTGTDMKTAIGAGMIPVGALWGFRDEEELRTHGALHLIAHPAELLRLL